MHRIDAFRAGSFFICERAIAHGGEVSKTSRPTRPRGGYFVVSPSMRRQRMGARLQS